MACSTTVEPAHDEQGAAALQAEQAEQGAVAAQVEQPESTNEVATTGDCTTTGRISTWRWPRGAKAVTVGAMNVVVAIGAKFTVCGTNVEVTGMAVVVMTGIAAVTGTAVDQVGA